MKKLESFKKEIFTKEEMKTIKGGKNGRLRYIMQPLDLTKTRCNGTTTGIGSDRVQDCGDSNNNE